MAFTVEDGTVVADANSLCTVEFADEYFADRYVTEWIGTDEAKQGALIRATDYVEIRWGDSLKGTKLDDDQELCFPRSDIGFDDVVPVRIKKAVAEYALRTLDGTPLAPDPEVTETGRVGLISESHKTGPIEDTYRYASRGTGQPPPTFRPYPAADQLMTSFLKSVGTSVVK